MSMKIELKKALQKTMALERLQRIITWSVSDFRIFLFCFRLRNDEVSMEEEKVEMVLVIENLTQKESNCENFHSK